MCDITVNLEAPESPRPAGPGRHRREIIAMTKGGYHGWHDWSVATGRDPLGERRQEEAARNPGKRPRIRTGG
jgi:hypothetical protein